MHASRRVRPSRQSRSIGNSIFNGLVAIGSHPVRAIAVICAGGLVLSSAGFGATYAWISSSPHGLMVGFDAMMMAVALEGAKPLAVASALSAFRSWAIVRGLALLTLAAAAIAFSLTSELALIAGNRGDLAAKRGAIIAQHDARDRRIEAAQSELAALAPSRTAAEVEADIAKLMADNPKAGDCHVMDGPVSRAVCPQVAALNGEIARTRRRAELQGEIATLTDAMPAAVGTADPASSALSSYLGVVFGVHVPASAVAEWLMLIPVLALELGAALAMVLVEAVTAMAKPVAKPDHEPPVAQLPATDSGASVNKSDGVVSGHPASKPRKAPGRPLTRRAPTPPTGKERRVRANTAARIMEALKAQGGRLEAGSVRKIAKLIGGRKSTVHSTLGTLLATGAVGRVGRALVLSQPAAAIGSATAAMA
jgi:hypothetical protein